MSASGSPLTHVAEQYGHMDPADMDQICHPVVSQGAILSQHNKSLQDIKEELCELSIISRIQQQLSQPAAVSSAPLTQHAASPAPPAKEPWILPPERYEGELGLCAFFLQQCNLVFDQQPFSYTKELLT